jgi:uncharacterized ion transporter superfamily protein YfcC
MKIRGLKKSPDSLLIVSVILILFTILTWIIPAGEYDRIEKNGRNIVVPNSYHHVDAAPQGVADVLRAPLFGFEAAADIIAFVLLVGGAFSLFSFTGAFDAFFLKMLKLASRKPKAKSWIIVGLMILFSFGGMSFGMSEETLVFVLITLPLARSLGYDNFVGLAIPFVGAGAGFAGAAYNPFTVGIAQGIAELPLFSGAGYRLIVWAVFTTIAILFVLWYARRLTNGKAKPFFGDQKSVNEVENVALTKGHIVALLLFLLSLAAIAWGAVNDGWYIPEICALFIALGITAALLNPKPVQSYLDAFYSGVKTMVPAALVICLSKAILVVADNGHIVDTVLFAMAESVNGLPKVVSVQLMFLVQGFLNFFIPSGSGQAAVTMPIMTPFSDIVGISRQTAVLAYQFGDGLFNLVIPTSGVTMGALAIAGIPFDKWIKWVWKLMVILILASMIFLALPMTVFEWV